MIFVSHTNPEFQLYFVCFRQILVFPASAYFRRERYWDDFTEKGGGGGWGGVGGGRAGGINKKEHIIVKMGKTVQKHAYFS